MSAAADIVIGVQEVMVAIASTPFTGAVSGARDRKASGFGGLYFSEFVTVRSLVANHRKSFKAAGSRSA